MNKELRDSDSRTDATIIAETELGSGIFNQLMATAFNIFIHEIGVELVQLRPGEFAFRYGGHDFVSLRDLEKAINNKAFL